MAETSLKHLVDSAGSLSRAAKFPRTDQSMEIDSEDAPIGFHLPDEICPATIPGQPPAWATNRSELCDALPYFRSYQSGCYRHEGRAMGFLLDADCGDRSYVDNEVVITRVGGGCTKDANGNLVQLKDQGEVTNTVASLNCSKSSFLPVGLVVGDRCNLLERRIPHRYNVMSYFRVTDIWYEKVGKHTAAKVRFEKLDLENLSWWAPDGSLPPLRLSERQCWMEPEAHECPACGKQSRRVYAEGWMCLKPKCAQYWTIAGSQPQDLTFDPGFLNYRTIPDSRMVPMYNLVPNLLATISANDHSVTSTRIAWKGVICPQCKKCISRRFWRGWKCTDDIDFNGDENVEHCNFEKMMTMHPISLRTVVDDFELSPIKRPLLLDRKMATPEIDDESLYPYRKLTYDLPGVGSVTHFVANRSINNCVNGPNDLFRQLQLADLGLRRYPLQQSVVAGMLTSHFAVNYGMPYKYVVSVDSKGFDQAPNEMLRALGRLTWATEKAVAGTGDSFHPPNEMLTLGYFEEMKIGYHDDGESSLGPTIATLSLGAKATMLIRMKYKYYNGASRAKKLLKDDPVLENCQLKGKRRELKEKFESGQITQQAYDKQREEAFKKRKAGEAAPFIKMELNHGDLVVMHGENLQKYYEHSVVPDNRLRFALTARYIKPGHVDEQDERKGEFHLTPDQVYDGK